MKKGIKTLLVAGLVAVMGIVALTGCGGSGSSGDSGDSSGSKDSGKITIAGSTSVQPLSEFLAQNYTKDNKDVKIDVQGGGSGQAAKSLQEGIAQIGALSREVEDEEKETIKKEYTIAMDGVAVVVNKDTDVDDLTIKQLKDIYTGKITNWSQVGGKSADIAVVSREEGSGTRGAFTEITGVLEKNGDQEKDNTTKDAIVQSSTGSVIETVGSTPNSIGYVSLEAVDDSVKALKVEGVKCTADTIKDKSYKISRPFIYAVGKDVDATTQAYIDWVMSDEGQAKVKEAGFIPVD
ncbi:MAG: phosphate ABC transporter substrate-binding protein [Anaerovoracaceae bacterium]|jgi:phosphate transport system substrate-binding protein